MKPPIRMPRTSWIAAIATAGALLTAMPEEARACGGFFCSSTPIDQTAEHILFTINDDQTVTAYVQISYTGQRDAFAWIIPVGGIPTLAADFPQLALQGLDTATQPRYFKNQCYQGDTFATPGAAVDAGVAGPDGVTVLARQNVGPYDTVTLQGTSASGLVDWLQTNGYRITDKMKPIIAPYVADGSNFVAMRLLPDKDVTDITPLTMTYSGNQPTIPIRLTAVAATPEMGIVTWILTDRRYQPDNYVDLKIPDSLIQFDQNGYQSNYLTVVSEQADKFGGQAFVTEYAKSTDDIRTQIETQFVPNADAQAAKDALLPLLRKFPYITRLYTRMSAEEMTTDPRFVQASDSSDVSNVHDLTDPAFNSSQCNQQPPAPSPCLFTYCGRRGVCAATEATVANSGGTTPQVAVMPSCVCASDATARPTAGDNGVPSTYCEPLAQNLDAAGATGTGTLASPGCEAFSCGTHGECSAMNGNPTCRCEAGYGAVAQQVYDPTTSISRTQVTCEKITGIVPALPLLPPVGQTTFQRRPAAAVDSGGCSIGGNESSGSEPILRLLFGLAAAGGLRRAGRRTRKR
jgi:hypothetical protein